MRRMILLTVMVALVALAAVKAYQSPAQQQPKVAQIEKLKDRLYIIKGGGGNTAAFLTDNGVVVVDTKLAGWGQEILDKIKSVTDKPVTTIINTHTHGDHVGSNEAFPASVDIVTHANTKANMETMPAFHGDKAKFLPKRTFKDTMALNRGKDRIDLYHFGAGHTNGDAIVVFPALRVAHMGDLFANQGVPFADAANGGTMVEFPKTIAKAVAGVKGVDTLIRGHSDPTDWKMLQEYSEFLRDLVAAVQGAMKAGKTADEAFTSLSLPARYKDYNMQRAKDAVTLLYTELKK